MRGNIGDGALVSGVCHAAVGQYTVLLIQYGKACTVVTA
jgi:hypothetical protein